MSAPDTNKPNQSPLKLSNHFNTNEMPRTRVLPVARRTSRPSGLQMEWLKEPVSVWEHLRILSGHNYAEDTILLYEVTNTSTASGHWTVPSDTVEYATYRKIYELYERTKRYPQAGAMLRAVLQTLPGQRPFTSPKETIPETSENREEHFEREDRIWFAYYVVLQKSGKFKESYDALMRIRGAIYKNKRDQHAKSLAARMKAAPGYQHFLPDQWKADSPDENSARICSSSLHPVMSVLRKGNGNADTVKKFSAQFTGEARKNVFWWLKSFEAVGKNKFVEAIECLRKMSHQNGRVLTEMAKLNYAIDKRDEARRLLKTAHLNDPLWIDGMDMLAFLCLGNDFQDMPSHSDFLERLISTLQTEWPQRIEMLTVSGFIAHQVDFDVAQAFSNRAMRCAVPGTEQYIYAAHLKVFCLKTLKKNPEANKNHRDEILEFLEEAVEAMPQSPDLALLYVDTLLETDEGHRDAKIFATKFLHENPNNVHAKLLKVHVLVNGIVRNPEVNHTTELFRLLEEITKDYPHILTGFSYLLSEYDRARNSDKCREVIKKLDEARQLIPRTKTPKFHRLKVDHLMKLKEAVPAYHHLLAALATGSDMDLDTIATYESEMQQKIIPEDYSNLEFSESAFTSEISIASKFDSPVPEVVRAQVDEIVSRVLSHR